MRMRALNFREGRCNCAGSTAIEYALIASAIALAIAIPMVVLGDGLSATYAVIGSLMTLI